MYPSGDWVGHWDQEGMGRQTMHDLVLQFDGSQLRGQGRDCVGDFTLKGQITDEFTVRIVKQYHGRHAVIYEGSHDGEGMIFGAWALFGDNGTFALRPAGGFRRTSAPIPEWVPPADPSG